MSPKSDASPHPPPEPWLRGPVAGVPADLQPAAHALIQAMEEADAAAGNLDARELWTSVGGAATAGFHLRHMAASTDRLLTYARGESLSEEQRAQLKAEKAPVPEMRADELLRDLRDAVERGLDQLRRTRLEELDAPRAVGRAGHPSTVRGLLHHAAEHAARHAGQLITTVKVVRALSSQTQAPGS